MSRLLVSKDLLPQRLVKVNLIKTLLISFCFALLLVNLICKHKVGKLLNRKVANKLGLSIWQVLKHHRGRSQLA